MIADHSSKVSIFLLFFGFPEREAREARASDIGFDCTESIESRSLHTTFVTGLVFVGICIIRDSLDDQPADMRGAGKHTSKGSPLHKIEEEAEGEWFAAST
jgi:hypothetical protein